MQGLCPNDDGREPGLWNLIATSPAVAGLAQKLKTIDPARHIGAKGRLPSCRFPGAVPLRESSPQSLSPVEIAERDVAIQIGRNFFPKERNQLRAASFLAGSEEGVKDPLVAQFLEHNSSLQTLALVEFRIVGQDLAEDIVEPAIGVDGRARTGKRAGRDRNGRAAADRAVLGIRCCQCRRSGPGKSHAIREGMHAGIGGSERVIGRQLSPFEGTGVVDGAAVAGRRVAIGIQRSHGNREGDVDPSAARGVDAQMGGGGGVDRYCRAARD